MGENLFGIGFGELLFLAILALIIFGPKRIPEIGRAVGRFLRQVREAASGVDEEVRQWLDGGEGPPTHPEEKLPPPPQMSLPAVSPAGSGSPGADLPPPTAAARIAGPPGDDRAGPAAPPFFPEAEPPEGSPEAKSPPPSLLG